MASSDPVPWVRVREDVGHHATIPFLARQGAHKFYLEQPPLQCVCQPVTVQHLPEAGESSLPIELAPSLTLTVVSNCRLDTRCDSACWDCLRAASVRDRGMMDQGCPNEAVSVLSYSLHGWLRSHRVESRQGWVEFSRDFKAVRSVVLTPFSIFYRFFMRSEHQAAEARLSGLDRPRLATPCDFGGPVQSRSDTTGTEHWDRTGFFFPRCVWEAWIAQMHDSASRPGTGNQMSRRGGRKQWQET